MPNLLRLFNLRERDRGHLRAFTPVFALVTASSVVTISFAKSLFITSNAASALPWMFISASLFTAFAAMGYVALAGRFSPRRRINGLLSTAISTFAALGLLVHLNPPLMSLIIYAWSTGISQLVIIQTWSNTTTNIPTRSARRLFPVFAAAATIGAASGGALTRVLLPVIGHAGLIYVAVALLAATWFFMRRAQDHLERGELDDHGDPSSVAARPQRLVARPSTPSRPASTPHPNPSPLQRVGTAFGALRRFPMLASIAALAFFGQIASVTLDFQFSAALKVSFGPDEMAGFLGMYYAGANLLSLFVGLLAGSRLTRSIGIGFAAAAGAVMLALGSAASSALYFGGVTTLLWPIVAASFGERILHFGVAKPAVSAAYTPLPPAAVESGKFIIDGVVQRLATLCISVALLVWAGDLLDYGQLSPVVLIFASLTILVGLRLGASYRGTLFAGLRERRFAANDATTPWAHKEARTVVRTLLATGNPADVVQGLELSRELGLELPSPIVRRLTGHSDPIIVVDLVHTLTVVGGRLPHEITTQLLETDGTHSLVLREVLRALPRGPHAKSPEYQSLVPAIDHLTHHADPAVASLAFVWLRANASAPVGATRLLTYELKLMRDLASKDRGLATSAVHEIAVLGRTDYIAPLLDAMISPALRQAVFTALERFPVAAVLREADRRLAGTSGLSDAERVWLLRLVEQMGGDESARMITPYIDAQSEVVKDQATRSLWALARRGVGAERESLTSRAATEISALARLALFGDMAAKTLKPGNATAMLAREVGLSRARAERRVFRLLGLLYSPAIMGRASLGYRDKDARVRSNAIELLDTTVEVPELRDFIAYIEASQRVDGATRTTARGADGLLRTFGPLLAEAARAPDPCLAVLGDHPQTAWLRELYDWAVQSGDDHFVPGTRWQRLSLLTRVGLFDRVPAQDLEPISALAMPVQFRAGDVLFREGDEAEDLYLLVDGEVDVVTASQGRVAVLATGECVGEMGVLDSAPRSATVTALSSVRALRIARPDFEDLLELFPAVARGIISVLTERLRKTQASRQRETAAA